MDYGPEWREGYVPTGDSLKLFYRRWGNGSNIVVVPSQSWLEADFEQLAAPDRMLLFFDTRGRGGSDAVVEPSQVEVDYELRDLESVRQFFGITRMSLLGWSMFGTTVARYAAAHPEHVTRLVLMCPGYIRSEAPYLDMGAIRQKSTERIDPIGLQRLEELKQAELHIAEPESYCKEHQRVYLPRQMGRPEALIEMKSNPCQYGNEWPRNLIALIQKLQPAGAYDWRSVAASIQAPTLVIHGSEDLIPLESSAEWAETIPDAELVIIKGAGHYPHLEAPEVFYPAVDGFLNG